MDFETTFPEIMKNGGFDAIVGNPPYGAELSERIRKYCEKKYCLGNTDTAALFILKSFNLIRNKGYLGYIIPKGFTYASNWKKTREAVVNNLSIIIDCSKVWKDVKYEMSIIILTKGIESKQYKSYQFIKSKIVELDEIDKELVDKFGFIVNGVNDDEIKIALKVKSNTLSLNDFFENRRGCMYQKYVSNSGTLRVLGGKQISRYFLSNSIKGRINKNLINDEKAYINKNSILVQRIVAHVVNPKPRVLIIASGSNQINVEDTIIVDTINQLTNKSIYKTDFFLGIINSKLISWYAYRFIYANAIRTMQFDNPTTSKIPIPEINLQNEKQKIIYEKIISLVDQMLDSQKHLYAVTTEKDETYWKSRCDSIDKEIDKLVYELYGLTEEEIRIVEGNDK